MGCCLYEDLSTNVVPYTLIDKPQANFISYALIIKYPCSFQPLNGTTRGGHLILSGHVSLMILEVLVFNFLIWLKLLGMFIFNFQMPTTITFEGKIFR
jgi:hypothetical protein